MDVPCDAVIGYAGRSYLVEIKNPKGKNKLTGPQEQFLSTWRGDYTIMRTIDEADAFARLYGPDYQYIPQTRAEIEPMEIDY